MQGQGTVLLVDDNQAFIDSVKDILEDEGYEVDTARTGEDACHLVKQKVFDLVLMDIKMPGMNGVQSFAQMKSQNPNVKVVLMTAYALNELIQQAQENGVMAILKKPLKMEKLIRLIEQSKHEQTGGRILIADDDKVQCENLRDNLIEYGYRVVPAYDADDAVSKAEKQAFDILLLDIKMPNRDGLQIYRAIKKIQPYLVTILMTGYAEQMRETIRQAIDENADTVLSKPIQMDRLLSLLKKVKADLKTETVEQTKC